MKKSLIIMLLLAFSASMFAQDEEVAKYKAMFTLNFIRYIGWAEDAKQGDFVIGVLREKTIATNLQSQTVGKKFGYQNIVVKEFAKVEDITDCQILYFSNAQSYSKSAELVKQKLGGKNSLIITETEGAINDGAMINFVVRDDKLKFELSIANADKYNVKFSSSLTSLSNAIVK